MTTTAVRERILQATVRTLAQQGFSRTSARAIARTGGFAPGVIYYHFDDLDDLFVATIRHTSQVRMRRYESELDDVTSAVELLRRLRQLYDEDTAEGHIAAVQELISAAPASPRLVEQVRTETGVWQDFARRTIDRLLSGTLLAGLVPVAQLAKAAVATYLGLEMLTHLDPGRTDPHALFDAAAPAAAMLDTTRPD